MQPTLCASLPLVTDRRRQAAALAVCSAHGSCHRLQLVVRVGESPRHATQSARRTRSILVSRKGPKPTERTMQLLRRLQPRRRVERRPQSSSITQLEEDSEAGARPRKRIRDGRARLHHRKGSGNAARNVASRPGARVLRHLAGARLSLSVRLQGRPVRSTPTIRSSAARRTSTTNRWKECCGWCARTANFGPARRAPSARRTTPAPATS